MTRLPPPTNFAEGQRLVYGLLAGAAGMFCGLCALGMVALLMWGGWSKAEEHTIVVIFGWALGGYIVAMVAVIVGLLAGGPVGRFKASVSKDGATLEADASDGPTVTTTTTVTPPTAKPAPPAPGSEKPL